METEWIDVPCARCAHLARWHPGEWVSKALDTPPCLGDLGADTVAMVEPFCACPGFAPKANHPAHLPA